MQKQQKFYGGHLRWKINSFRPNVRNGTSIETPEFPIPEDPDCSFKLQLFENGSSSALKNNISLYFNLNTDSLCSNEARWSSVSFQIKDAIGNVLKSKDGWKLNVFRKHESKKSVSRGWGKFLSHAEVPPRGISCLYTWS